MISESLPKRVGTCFENCSVDEGKHGTEQRYQQVRFQARGPALGWEEVCSTPRLPLEGIFRTPLFLEQNFCPFLHLKSYVRTVCIVCQRSL